MISVLIPIYNFNAVALVKEAQLQLQQFGVKHEILCYDDASDEVFRAKNRCVASLPGVRYLELVKNAGRAKIRNRLAEDARYNYLLFIDCDSKIISGDFIKKYLALCKPGTVVFGGRCYEPAPPPEPGKYLHWYYGSHREIKPAKQRQKEPYRLLFTNNILIPKPVYSVVRLDERVTGYGYEDSLFGYELKKKGIPVLHIDNPLCHMGIEDSGIFLEKTNNALKNLAMLTGEKKIGKEVKIARYHALIQALYMTFLTFLCFRIFKRFFLKNLLSRNPSLLLFDLYRLGMLLGFTASFPKPSHPRIL